MKKSSLVTYFVVLFILCAVVIIGAKMLGQQGAYLVQLYMLAPAISAILTRLFFYKPKFSDANLRFGKLSDYFKFWFISICITVLSYILFTLLGSIAWDFTGQVFLDRLAEQFAMAGQDINASLPPGFTPMMMLMIYFIGGLTVFNILPGIITGFGEEFGHRGFMFPLLYKIKPWVGIIVGGLIWYAWHLPLALVIPQTSQYPLWQNLLNFIILAIGSVCTFTYLAYVYVKSRSIWVTSLAHIVMNNSASSFSYFAIIQNQILANVGLALTMMIVVAVLYIKKELDIFPKYFQDNNTGYQSVLRINSVSRLVQVPAPLSIRTPLGNPHKRQAMMSKNISRRDFLKIAGAAAGTVIAAEVVTPLIFPEKLDFDENVSLWAPAQPPKNPALAEDIEVDVAIIGGGYTGLSSAYYILQRYPEKSVAVFEARGVGQGASGRNGGMLLAQTANEYMAIYSDAKTHRRLYDVTVKHMDDLAEIVKAQGIDSELRRNGVLLVIARESQVAKYKQYAQAAQTLGMPIEFWNRARTKSEIGTDVYFASLFDPNAGEVHPMRLVHALKKVAESAGAHIYEDSPVFELQDGENIRLTVGEQNHTVIARAVVLATNGYTSKLGYFKNSVFPIHTPMAATPSLPDSTFEEIGWKNKAGFSDTYTLLYHLSRTSDNRILIGSGYVNYFFNNGIIDKDDPAMLKAYLQKELGRIYPKLTGMEFEHFWTGVLGFSLDFMQSVGVMGAHRNIYYGLCYAGHGINLATLFGKVIADIYAGEESLWEGMPFLNHHYISLPPEPLKWLGVQATIQYYKADDAGK